MTESNITVEKLCGKCAILKPLSEFNKNKNRPDGLAWECRQCNRARSKEKFLENKERYNANNRAHYEGHKEFYKEKAKKWSAENKEKRGEISRQYVKNNPEKRAETSRNNRTQNPGLYAAHYKARQQRKRKAMPAWANEENIKAIYRQCAFVTRITGIKHHVDHYFPLQSSLVCGLHNEYNLRIIPAAANLSKANKIPEE